MKKMGLWVILVLLMLSGAACRFPFSPTGHTCQEVPSLIRGGVMVEVWGGLEGGEGDILIGNYNNARLSTYVNPEGELVSGPVIGISVSYRPAQVSTPSLQVYAGMTFVAFEHWFHVTHICPDTEVVRVEFIPLDQTDQRPVEQAVDMTASLSTETYTPWVIETLAVKIGDVMDLPLAVSDDEVMMGETVLVQLQILDEPTQYLYERLPVGGELDLGRYEMRLAAIDNDRAQIEVESKDQAVVMSKRLLSEPYSGERVGISEGDEAAWDRWAAISLREAGYARYVQPEGMIVGPIYELMLVDQRGIVFSEIVHPGMVADVFGSKIGVVGWQKPEGSDERQFILIMDYIEG
jgi:hypothetical protein